MDNRDTNNFLYGIHAIKLEDYLRVLGLQELGGDKEYLLFKSPFGGGTQTPLRINTSDNIFIDPASDNRGRIIEFGRLFHQLDTPGFLDHLRENYPSVPRATDHPLLPARQELQVEKIISIKDGIDDPGITQMLKTRGIPQSLAQNYCKQIEFVYWGERITGLGLGNDNNGFAISHPSRTVFHGPMDISTLVNDGTKIDVFQNTLDMLSYKNMKLPVLEVNNDITVLHDFRNFENNRYFLEGYRQVNLHLDANAIGREFTAYAKWLDKEKYQDFSRCYKNYLNYADMFAQRYIERQQKQDQSPKKHSL